VKGSREENAVLVPMKSSSVIFVIHPEVQGIAQSIIFEILAMGIKERL